MPTTALPNGMLVHTCETCGIDRAPFGYNVSLLRGRMGSWYCREHRPQSPQDATTRKTDDQTA